MEYKISGKITFDDFLHFNKYYLNKYILMRMVIIIFTMIIISFSFWIYNFKDGFSFNSQDILPYIAFAFIIYSVIRIVFSKKRYRKLYDTNKSIEEECHYIINENSIIINSESSNSTINKKNVYKIIIDKNYIYIFWAANIYKIINNSFCENDEEYNNLVLFFRENYKEKIKLK